MLHLNLEKLITDKGVEKPYSYLTRNGFSGFIASKLLNNKVSQLSLYNIEKLCLLLRCTPDELFEWHPANNTPADHPMHKLVRKDDPFNVSGKLQELSPDKLKQVKEFLKTL